ncbi:hypothetical protein V501_01504 [Pseudogymnoascus sp. VKM F-4519 (FW-2642)]|nr:hypothetical protein V501_01504 [Pseudogymnoascus sp. VKM F-4519 (FW-2642)]
MARTRPVTNGPTPKSAPTTQNNGVKKSSKPSEQQLYVVSRETNDPEGVHDNHEIVGTYKTLAAANAAARDDLIKGWGREYFDEYEASEVDGMVHVIATCPDGEEMVVMVEKSGVRKAIPPPKAVEEQSYVVLRRSNTDEVKNILGPSEIVGTYKTLGDANTVARDYLIKGPGRENFELCEVKEVNGMVEAFAKSHDGYQEVGVVVHKNTAPSSKMTAAPTSAKQYTYTVTRETIDPRYQDGDFEIIGTYETLAAANAVARNNMIEEWGVEYFDDFFEVQEVDGRVRVDAVCPDGESMSVRIEKTEINKSSVAEKPAAENPAVGVPEEITVYHVSTHTIDYHHDPDGGMQDTAIVGTYLSLAKANQATREYPAKEWDMDFFEEFDETVHNGMVAIKARCAEGEEMNIYVEKGKLFTYGEGLREMEEELEDSMSESDGEGLREMEEVSDDE